MELAEAAGIASMNHGLRPHLWDERERQLVLHMLVTGASAGKIADYFHITRNAAIGRISRDQELHDHHVKFGKKPGNPKPPKKERKVKVEDKPEPKKPSISLVFADWKDWEEKE